MAIVTETVPHSSAFTYRAKDALKRGVQLSSSSPSSLNGTPLT